MKKLVMALVAALIAAFSCGGAIVGAIYISQLAGARGVTVVVANGFMWSGFMIAVMIGVMHVVGQIGYFRNEDAPKHTTLYLMWVPLPMVALFFGGFILLMPFLAQHNL